MPKGDIVFAFGGAFLLGILVASLGNLWWMALVASATFLFSFLKWNWKYSFFLIAVLFIGFFYFFLFRNMTQANWEAGQVIQARVSSQPQIFSKHQKFGIHSPEGNGWVITAPETIYKYGDDIKVNVKNIETNELIFPDIEFVRSNKSLRGRLYEFQSFVISKYKKNLSHDSAALMSGIMLGYKSDFTKDFKENLSKSGTAHIVALSGYNIAVLIVAVNYFLAPFAGRKLKFLLIITFIILFTIMVGGESSIVRAAIMGLLVVIAKQSGKMYDMRNAIVLAAFLMVLFDPLVLVFDIGFQLSFFALLGVVYLSPIIQRLFNRLKPDAVPYLKEAAATTLSAQLMVSPLILNSFGSFSILGFFANILILVFVPPTMFLGLVLFLSSVVWSGLSTLVGWFAEFILRYMMVVIDIFSNLHLGPEGSMNFIYVILYYSLIVIFIRNQENELV